MSYQEEGDAELFDSDEDIPVPPPPAGDEGEDEGEENAQDTPSKGYNFCVYTISMRS